MDYDKIKLGQRIAAARNRKMFKQDALGAIIGISQPQISGIENGNVDVPIGILYKIADVLDVSVLWLLGELQDESDDFSPSELLDIQKFKKFLKSIRE